MVRIKRVYEEPSAQDGRRFLIDRLWPRAMKKEALKAESWLKDVAPGKDLLEWFAHDPSKWAEFRHRYSVELRKNRTAWDPLLQAAREGPVTLLYSARDTEHNNAVVLKDYLDARLKE